MVSNPLSRIRAISIVITLVSVLFIGRLFVLQVVRGAEYVKDGEQQYMSSGQNLFERGTIYFTEKNGQRVSAATIKTTYFIAINPKLLKEPESAYAALSQHVSLEREAFMSKALKVDDPYEIVFRGMDEETSKKVRGEKIPGVSVYQENTRYYPNNERAAHALGLVGQSKNDGDTFAGRYGLEMQYNDVLSRKNQNLYTNFFADVFSDIGESIDADTIPEGDIVLSIEPTVQAALEKELLGIEEKWKSEAVGAIVIEPKTGRIIAMGSLPSFDPNLPSKESSSAVFSNPLVESVYEMGSIVKPLTIAAALDEKVITPSTTYNDKGSLVMNGKTIRNYDGKARGVVPIQEILSQSLNTGVVFAVEKLGTARFASKMRAFGLGERTGIDLPSEGAGLVKTLESTREIDYATASYGQGIAITPIQTVRALSVLANGGWLVEPHLVDSIEYPLGSKKEYEPKQPPVRVLQESTSREISHMLQVVVDDVLAHGTAKLATHTIAAKTGTAQIKDPKGKGYYTDRYLHSFFGYFPVQDPQFLVFFYQKHPVGAQYASETLTQPFMTMAKFLISYYQIPPDRLPELSVKPAPKNQ